MCQWSGGALSGIGQETGRNFYTSFTCRVVEDSAWKLGFVFKIQATGRTVSGGVSEWLIVLNCILLCSADH